ncbi:hypothetical protein ACFLVR_03705 [Chloroflexota bacterium]
MLPIVALALYTLPGDRQKALESGCTGYLTKPINPETVVSEIKNYL